MSYKARPPAILHLCQPIKVYNFEVVDWHTYFVSDEDVLVHNTCYIIGKPHGASSHQQMIYDEAVAMVASGNYSAVFMNRSLNSAGLSGTQRPDIIGIGANGTPNRIIEYQSPGGQQLGDLFTKMKTMGINNPSAVVEVYDKNGKIVSPK